MSAVLKNTPEFLARLAQAFDHQFGGSVREIKVGDDVRCDRAILLEDRVRVHSNGMWIDLIPPKSK